MTSFKKITSQLVTFVFVLTSVFTTQLMANQTPVSSQLVQIDSFSGDVVSYEEYKVIDSVEAFSEFYHDATPEVQEEIMVQLNAARNSVPSKYKKPSFWKRYRRGDFCQRYREGLVVTATAFALVIPIFIPVVIVAAILYAPAFVIDKLMGCKEFKLEL